ncbi:MAG: efflux RND transporter periplasmic adaptor subunit [Chitinophagales bacterium]
MKNRFILYIISVVLLLSSCGNKTSTETQAPEAKPQAQNTSAVVSFTPEQVKSIGLETGSIEKKQLTASLKASGILKVPNQNRASVTALMGGIVKSINVQTGNSVKAGQTIATISNTSFIQMQEEYISVSSKETLAEAEFNRQKELQAGNAGALKTFQQSEAELKSIKARKASLQRQLELLGINTKTLTDETMQSAINITSPVSGSVSSISVNIGSYVDANNVIAEVIDNSQLHLDLFIYERDLSKLKQGQTIHFTLTNNPGKEYDARIYAISNTFEPGTKTIAVHATVEGDKAGLIDGMSITALISLENATVDAVPTDAIVNYQGRDYIFITESEGGGKSDVEFSWVPIAKGSSEVGYTEITPLAEVPANTKVVTKGAFFVLAKMTNAGGE